MADTDSNNSILYPNSENPTGKDSNTDKDGLTDWDEVDVERWKKAGLIYREDNGYINLPTLKQCMDYTEISYVQEGLGRFVSQPTISLMLNDIRVMPISSDPTRQDSDGDGVLDIYDKNPLIPIDVFSPCLNSGDGYVLNGVENHNMGLVSIGNVFYYRCKNCGEYCVLAPEEQDRELLLPSEQILVANLITIRQSYLLSGDVYVGEYINWIIDRIRKNHNYEYCDSNYNYVSPNKYAFSEQQILNDTLITINVNEYYNTYKVQQAYKALAIEMLNIGRAAMDYYIIAGEADLFLSISWAICSEIIFAKIEEREIDYSSVLFSVICSLTDNYLPYNYPGYDAFDGFSSTAFAYSYFGSIVSQLAIGEKAIKENPSISQEPTLRYAVSVTIQTLEKSYYFRYDYAYDISHEEFPILDKIEREADDGHKGKYKNALFLTIEDRDGTNPTKYITGIIGDYYYEFYEPNGDGAWKNSVGEVVHLE